MMKNPKMDIQILWRSHRVYVKNMVYLPNLKVSFLFLKDAV